MRGAGRNSRNTAASCTGGSTARPSRGRGRGRTSVSTWRRPGGHIAGGGEGRPRRGDGRSIGADRHFAPLEQMPEGAASGGSRLNHSNQQSSRRERKTLNNKQDGRRRRRPRRLDVGITKYSGRTWGTLGPEYSVFSAVTEYTMTFVTTVYSVFSVDIYSVLCGRGVLCV